MLPARLLESWVVVKMDVQDMSRPSVGGNKVLLLIVDRSFLFPFAFPLPTKEAVGVVHRVMSLCLTFGVPKLGTFVEFTAEVMKHLLCRWLQVEVRYGPAEHPRAQGAVERIGAWFHDILPELCVSRPER